MPERRMKLPGASELFRPTADAPADQPSDESTEISAKSTGRVRHGDRITIYISPEELMELEKARLELRGIYGCSVDRGRIVRQAIAMALHEFASNGEQSELLAGLRAS